MLYWNTKIIHLLLVHFSTFTNIYTNSNPLLIPFVSCLWITVPEICIARYLFFLKACMLDTAHRVSFCRPLGMTVFFFCCFIEWLTVSCILRLLRITVLDLTLADDLTHRDRQNYLIAETIYWIVALTVYWIIDQSICNLLMSFRYNKLS